ncbi:TonB-dependent receptor [Prevotella sp. P2-180]|uniref:SusC/RagA family TonB-linked outer membrane protein n=1 Tax=Prevotella sp. P2-180 TaxID=2024224 RepID=UPI000B96852F|nr:TonB-dependent receptor [Prevotella sp. P2-180]OYP61598.1 SusC/RagA family protein [Prevotella sp. P2-180]
MKQQLKRASVALLMTMVCFLAFAQKTITGTVKDSSGEGVIGASVLEKGTQNGVVTDFDGNFTIKVSGKNPIVVSYIGMKTQTIAVGNKSKFDITLEDEATSLNDLVVIGYGTVRKKDLTGSVATVNNKALQEVPVASASEALTGKMAGVQVTTTEGSPDAEVKIRVRGGGSITQSNDPLYIVDGFPVETISDIPATDIEDITVLKDASSTAIYGSRGANGVILVTTKSGKSGKVNVSYNAYYSWKKIANTFDVLSTYDYAKWQYELALLKNENDLSSYTQYFGEYQDLDLYKDIEGNDWQDVMYGRTGNTFNHNVNITGGTDQIKYAFSYAHMNDKAILLGSSYKRDNFSLKLNTKPTKRTTLDFQARYSDTDVYGGGAQDATGAYDTDRRLKYSVIYTPIPLANLDASAGAADDDLGNLYNPVEAQRDNDMEREKKTLNIAGSFGWEVIDDLRLKTEFGYDDYNQYDKKFFGLTTYYVKNVPAGENQNMPAIRLIDTNRHRFRNTNTISYDFKKLLKSEDHSLNLLAGHEYVITKKRVNTNEAHGFPVDFDASTAWKLTSQGTPYQIDDVYSADDKLLSFFGRLNYNFQDKYLFSATFRADASSKFAKENRWGYFPSAAVAWRISSEPFMKGTSKWLDDLKLRFSYGTAGNNNIPVGQLSQTYELKTSTWVNDFTSFWAPSKTMANPDLKWETTITRNVGLDFTLFGGKFSGSVEAYLNTTKDLLIAFPVGGTGYDNQYRNMGETENKGLEITATWHAINKKNVGLDINGNIGFNKNKIKDLGAMEDFGWNSRWASTEIGQDYWLAVGQPVGQIRGYQSAGRYEVSDFEGYDKKTGKWILKEGVADATPVIGTVRPGSLKLVDQPTEEGGKGNGMIGEEDNVIIGDVNPDFTGGFGINARAYGFDLSAQFNFSVGNEIYNANKIEFTSTGKYQYRNMITEMADGVRWTNLNEDGTLCNDPVQLAEMNKNTTMWSPYMSKMVLTDWAIENASFLRLNTLSLGYTLPTSLTKKAGINSLRFYVTAYNVFTITDYSGVDPESDCIRNTSLTPCVDYSGYPRSRSFVVGLNLNF